MLWPGLHSFGPPDSTVAYIYLITNNLQMVQPRRLQRARHVMKDLRKIQCSVLRKSQGNRDHPLS